MKSALIKADYKVIEYESLREESDYYEANRNGVLEALEDGYFIPLISANYFKSLAFEEMSYALDNSDGASVIPIFVNIKKTAASIT